MMLQWTVIYYYY